MYLKVLEQGTNLAAVLLLIQLFCRDLIAKVICKNTDLRKCMSLHCKIHRSIYTLDLI